MLIPFKDLDTSHITPLAQGTKSLNILNLVIRSQLEGKKYNLMSSDRDCYRKIQLVNTWTVDWSWETLLIKFTLFYYGHVYDSVDWEPTHS
jgi:hypothetical protein